MNSNLIVINGISALSMSYAQCNYIHPFQDVLANSNQFVKRIDIYIAYPSIANIENAAEQRSIEVENLK